MNRCRLGIALVVNVLLLTATSLPVAASSASPGEVTVISSEPPVVAKNLPWSTPALKAATALIGIDRQNLAAELKKLKSKGANRLQVIYEKQPLASESFADVEKYGTSFLPWHLIATTKSGSAKSRSSSFPGDQLDIAHYLTKLKKDECSLVGFSILNLATWFQPEACAVVSPTPSQFLRASLATALKKSSLAFGSFELAQLKFALGSNTHPRIVGRALICPELSPIFSGNTEIALEASDAVGGYVISVDLDNKTATFKFLGPDQASLASRATKTAGENFIRFFASQSTN